jgi:AcrR family transcriptional regulator
MTSPAAPDRKQQSHDRIVDAAARAVRERGYAGVGVADVMREAGLTHGGFYAHFPSRDALLVAALEQAGRHSAETMARRAAASAARGESAFRALVEGYLHDDLLEARHAGCPVAALCAEMPRQSGDVRKASTARLRALVRYVERCLPSATPPGEAAVVAATLVGSLQMARALGANAEGRALLADARRTLLARHDAA